MAQMGPPACAILARTARLALDPLKAGRSLDALCGLPCATAGDSTRGASGRMLLI